MNFFMFDNHKISEGKYQILWFDTVWEEGVQDTIENVEEDLFRWERVIDKERLRTQDLQKIKMKLSLTEPVEYYMIPGVIYNGNFWGEGKEPKGNGRSGVPWKFAWHRSGVPAGLFCQTSRWTVGMWGSLSNSQGFSGSLEQDERGGMSMVISFPEEEGPAVYCARDTYEERPYFESAVNTENKMKFTVWIKVGMVKEKYNYREWLDTVWKICEKEKPMRQALSVSDQKIWNLGIRFLTESAWFQRREKEYGTGNIANEESNNTSDKRLFSGFCMGLTWDGSRWVQKRDYLEIGWVGQNASCAVSLIYDGLASGNLNRVEQGMEILDCWLACRLENGLFRCRYERMEKYREEKENRVELQDAANLYSVTDEYLEAWRVLREAGIKREEYRETALAVCEFARKTQEKNGRMGKAWYNDGTCAQREGGIGCYMVLALCRAMEETGEEKYMDHIIRGFRFYYAQYLSDGYTTAGALDTCCIDKESAFPLLKTALFLYKKSEKREYLECAVRISSYIASWQYQYNVSFPDRSILGQIGYCSRGGMSVSTQHHHIDCYGLFIYEDWKLLAELTGDNMWRVRADAVWGNSLQNISDGTLSIKGQLRPAGSQDEGILQTRWHTKKGEYFGVSEWLVVWNTAFRLKLLRKEYLAKSREKDKLPERIC